MKLKIINADESYTHVALSGRMDATGTNEVETEFMEQVAEKDKSAIVDMTEVSFLSEEGMRLLSSAVKTLRTKGKKMILYNSPPLVVEQLQTAGFSVFMQMENHFGRAVECLLKA